MFLGHFGLGFAGKRVSSGAVADTVPEDNPAGPSGQGLQHPPEIFDVHIDASIIAQLAAFLRSLNEDYR